MSTTVDARPRGLCPKCGRSIQLTVGGLIRHHGGEGTPGTFGRRTYRCTGAGRLPLTCGMCGRRLTAAAPDDICAELSLCPGCNDGPDACRCLPLGTA